MPKWLRRTLKGLLIGSVVVAFLLFIAQDQETLRIRAAVGAHDPDALAYVTALVGAASTAGNDYQILNNGDEIFPAMLDAIAHATRRISFETYIYEKGSVGDEFTRAFEAAARRGVDVRLVVDSVGSGSMGDEAIKRLRDAGCRVETFNVANWWSLEEVNYRTHRKILVVDGETAYTGGVGVADHWAGHAQDKDHWRDVQVKMTGPIARLMEGAFFENFIEASASPVAPIVEQESGVPTQGNALIVRSSPTGGSSDLKRLYLLLIAIAQQRIDVQSPYFIPDSSTSWALEEAIARGVKVRILTESDTTDAAPVKYASRAAYDRFLSKGIEIYEYQPTMMHAKVMVVDGLWSMFGSANFDNRSLELNDELNVAVRSEGLAARFTEGFERDLSVSKPLTLEAWRRRPLWHKAREQFWEQFGEIF
jgi:cardiolipin synthase